MTCIERIKDSSKQMKKVTTLTGMSMLIALKSVIQTFRIQISNILEIGFSHLVVGINALYFGPVAAGISGIISDTLEFIIRPTGPYFPGFALNEFVIGFLYGLFFYKKEITLKRVILARFTVAFITEILMTPLWLHILYGNAFIALVSARIVTQIIKFPIDCALLYTLLKTMSRIKKA